MPKIIDAVREHAILEARRILTAPEYTPFTMRGVAAACGVAAGTLYNYFPSKEYLVGCVVLEDWQAALEEMTALACGARTIEQGLEGLYTRMREFVVAHEYLTAFDIRGGKDGFAYADRHILLRQQIEALLTMLETRFGIGTDHGITTFLAESILSFSTKKYDYSQLSAAFNKLLN